MSRLRYFFQSKVALAIIGTVLFGGSAAVLASASFAPANQPSATQLQSNINNSSDGSNTSTPEASPSATPTPGKSPTATPTRTPTPTPGIGQPTSLGGTVT